MTVRDTQKSEPDLASPDVRFAAVREELRRDVAEADARDVLTALVDALDRYQRKAPLRLPTR
jgi:hypothetical protein